MQQRFSKQSRACSNFTSFQVKLFSQPESKASLPKQVPLLITASVYAKLRCKRVVARSGTDVPCACRRMLLGRSPLRMANDGCQTPQWTGQAFAYLPHHPRGTALPSQSYAQLRRSKLIASQSCYKTALSCVHSDLSLTAQLLRRLPQTGTLHPLVTLDRYANASLSKSCDSKAVMSMHSPYHLRFVACMHRTGPECGMALHLRAHKLLVRCG